MNARRQKTVPIMAVVALLIVACFGATRASAQQTTGVTGSPDATTTIDGRYAEGQAGVHV